MPLLVHTLQSLDHFVFRAAPLGADAFSLVCPEVVLVTHLRPGRRLRHDSELLYLNQLPLRYAQ